MPPLRLAALVAVSALAWPGAASGQEPANPVLSGTVTVGADVPLPGATVVLHRVDAVDAGEVDSVRAGPGGTFRFGLPTVPDPANRGDVYFASVNHLGVLYFGPPVTTGVQLDSVYRIEVYDTTVVPLDGAPLTPAVRYILLEESPRGWQATDLFVLEVEGDRTLVAADSGVSWRYPLPPGHRDLVVGGGDVPPAAVSTRGDELLVTAPLTPGPRQLVVRYVLDSLTVEIPTPGGVGEMDFLVREPAPPMQVQGLDAAAPVEMEPGVAYRRFTGIGVQAQSLQVTQTGERREFPVRWLAVLLGLVLTAAGIYAVQRSPGGATRDGGASPSPEGPGAPGTAAPAHGMTREALILQVAELDETLEGTPEGSARERLRHRRASLLAELRRRS